MIFILIGPDMAGKTTLAKGLAAKFEGLLSYRKFSHYDSQEESVAAAVRIVEGALHDERSYLFDRFHFPDDLVYGPATNRYDIKPGVMETYTQVVAPKLMNLQTAYIFCTASIEILNYRFKLRGDDYIVPEHLPEVINRYMGWINGPHMKGFPIMHLDSGALTTAEMLANAADFIRLQAFAFRGRC
jgi:deoxyadenosine/deoxycytidine kinase